jgi:hypothetical protein
MRAGGGQRVWHSVARRVTLGSVVAGAAVGGASEQAAVTNAMNAAEMERASYRGILIVRWSAGSARVSTRAAFW